MIEITDEGARQKDVRERNIGIVCYNRIIQRALSPLNFRLRHAAYRDARNTQPHKTLDRTTPTFGGSTIAQGRAYRMTAKQ